MGNDEDFEQQDDEQISAITSTEPAIAVLAGPGSGKTRVLARRARELLTRNRDERVLLLTFTNKAAAEMKARALRALPVPASYLLGSTFHTFGLRLLSAHGELVGSPRTFEILDDEERKEFVAAAVRGHGVPDAYDRWSYLRVRRRVIEQSAVAEFGEAYQQVKRDAGVVDFDDLVVFAADLLERHPDVAVAYASRYPNILVDEFQDTNAAEFVIIRALAAHAKTVGVFADDDQAIYRFAGAESTNVRRFIHDLGAVEYPLLTNYRCRQAIVDRANRLIAADPAASGRQMKPHHAGGTVRVRQFLDTPTETAALAQEISDLTREGGVKASDVAVLGRASFRVSPLLAELRRLGVPTTSWLASTDESRERRAVRISLSVVRGELSPYESRRLAGLFRIDEERDPTKLLRSDANDARLNALQRVRDAAWRGDPVSEVLEAVREALRLVDSSYEARLNAMVAEVKELEAHDVEFNLEHLFADLALGAVGAGPTVGGGVKVSSLHRTKGLQWPYVYILGLEEGRLPFYRAETDEEIREERRLCFVGVCRAIEHLTLTHVMAFGGRALVRSRFLAEMGL